MLAVVGCIWFSCQMLLHDPATAALSNSASGQRRKEPAPILLQINKFQSRRAASLACAQPPRAARAQQLVAARAQPTTRCPVNSTKPPINSLLTHSSASIIHHRCTNPAPCRPRPQPTLELSCRLHPRRQFSRQLALQIFHVAVGRRRRCSRSLHNFCSSASAVYAAWLRGGQLARTRTLIGVRKNGSFGRECVHVCARVRACIARKQRSLLQFAKSTTEGPPLEMM